MKFVLLLSILFLWNAIEASSDNAVRDVAGEELRPNVKYYIVSAIWGAGGGGVTLAPRNGLCPFNVAQESSDWQRGLPLTFLPVNADDKYINLTTDVNIVFSVVRWVCAQSPVWRLGDRDEVTGNKYVTTGGETGNTSPNMVGNWFKIEKINNRFYKLVFCPSVCDSCEVICGDIGIFYEDGKRWLGLSDRPFPVVFIPEELEGKIKMAIE